MRLSELIRDLQMLAQSSENPECGVWIGDQLSIIDACSLERLDDTEELVIRLIHAGEPGASFV